MARTKIDRAAAVESLDLVTADRAAAMLLRSEPQIAHANDRRSAHELDDYTHAFLRRHAGTRIGVRGDDDFLTFFHVADWAVSGVPPQRVQFGGACDDALFARHGSRRVDVPDGRIASFPSVAHLVVALLTSDEELRALMADPDGWSPALAGTPVAFDRLPPPLMLDDRSRAWARIGAPTGLFVTMTVLLLMLAALVHGRPFQIGMLGGVALIALIAWASWRRCVEVYWLEPRARRLAMDDFGLAHPRTGIRTPWANVRALAPAWLGFDITFADGARVRIPHSLFVDGRHAQAHLATRVAKAPGGPYRR